MSVMTSDQPPVPIDPVCIIHGLRKSQHECLYCCLCWRSLRKEECNLTNENRYEDVCKRCAEEERKYATRNRTQGG